MNIKRYVPEELYNLLSGKQHFYIKDVFNLNGIELKVEGLYIVIDTIIRCSGQYDTSNDFICISKDIFHNILQNDYTMYIDYLIQNNIIICDNLYSKDARKAKGYKLNPNILDPNTDLIGIEISDKLFAKRTEKAVKGSNKKMKVSKDFKANFNNFELNYVEAHKKLIYDYNNAVPSAKGKILNIHTLKALQYKLKAIEDRQLSIYRNDTNGRITTNLTLLNSEYKQFLNNGFDHQIDLSASQPTLVIVLLELLNSFVVNSEDKQVNGIELGIKQTANSKSINSNILSYVYKMTLKYLGKEEHTYFWSEIKKLKLPSKNEIKKYKNLCCNGNLYETLMFEYKIPKENRTKFKLDFLIGMYESNSAFNKAKDIFVKEFPTIYTLLFQIKDILNLKTNKKWGILAIILQSLESYLFVELIIPKLEANKIPYQYIYDCIIVKKQHLQKSYEIMYSTITSYLNELLGDNILKIENLKTGTKIKIQELYV